jgi:peroxiredoxin Q/BCP
MLTTLMLLAMLVSVSEPAAQVEPKRPTPSQPGKEQSGSRNPTGQLHVSGIVVPGEQAPDFELSDEQGHPVRLAHYRGRRALLVFGERMTDLLALREVESGLRDSNVVVIAVCADKPQTLRPFVEREKIRFEMLSDSTREIAALYGLREPLRPWIMPGFIVLDRDGIVRMAVLGQQLPGWQILELARFSIGAS